VCVCVCVCACVCVCSYVLLECRCEATRDAAAIAGEVYEEAIAVPYQTALTVFARRQGPLDGRMQLFCTTADRPAGRSLEKREDYVKVATLNDVEVPFWDSCFAVSRRLWTLNNSPTNNATRGQSSRGLVNSPAAFFSTTKRTHCISALNLNLTLSLSTTRSNLPQITFLRLFTANYK